MRKIPSGETVTLSCAEGEQGRIYRGALEYEVDELDPSQFPRPRTQMMLNVGSPEQAFSAAMLPNDGVGLARMEFIFASWVKVHPLALTRYEECREDRDSSARPPHPIIGFSSTGSNFRPPTSVATAFDLKSESAG